MSFFVSNRKKGEEKNDRTNSKACIFMWEVQILRQSNKNKYHKKIFLIFPHNPYCAVSFARVKHPLQIIYLPLKASLQKRFTQVSRPTHIKRVLRLTLSEPTDSHWVSRLIKTISRE